MASHRRRTRARTHEAEPNQLDATAKAWLLRAMEALWLLTAGLVPVLFAPSDLMVFIDVPKVAVLRGLTGLMAVLWVVEWALRSASLATYRRESHRGQDNSVWRRFREWTREEPSRWIVVAATIFLAASAISTLLSPAPSISLWGSNPGRDGSGFYNTASYYLLFIVIATHLKTRAQVWRLLGVIAAAASVVSLYGVLQYFDLDPFRMGSAARVQSSFGNPLFAASFIVMAVPVSLGLGLVHGLKAGSLRVYAGWAALVALQLTAVIFTLSRGPWIGLAAGLLVWPALVGIAAGRRIFINAIIALSIVALVLVLAGMSARGFPGDLAENGEETLFDRTASIATEVTTGGLSGRLSIWKRSASLIVERPWFNSQERGHLPVRHLFGYGPELFRYALPLRWAPGADDLVNASAHNYFIHLGVELGLAGVAAYSALVAVLLVGGGVTFLRSRGSLKPEYSLIYAALLTSIAVRVVEQMVGVARVSDTALFWTIAALMAALPVATRTPMAMRIPLTMRTKDASKATPASISKKGRATPRRRTGWSASDAWRWGVVMVVLMAGTALIWEKNVSYARAAAQGSASIHAFQDRDLLKSLDLMDRAISLAPDVGFYYTSRARMMDSFAARDLLEEVDIAGRQHTLNMRALRANPLSHTAKLAAATSAFKLARLGQEDKGMEAVRLFKELTLMLPGLEEMYNNLASAWLVLGRPQESLAALDAYVEANGRHARPTAEALYLRGLALLQLGKKEESLTHLEQYLELSPQGRYAASAHQRLAEIYADLGRAAKRDEHAARYEELRR